MMTRSIVGRFLILAVLLVSLGVIAQAALIITKGGSKAVAKVGPDPVAPPAAVAAATQADAPAPAPASADASSSQMSADAAPVRVVYPGPLGDAPIQAHKFAGAAPATPPAPAPQPAAVPPVAVPPAQATASAPAVQPVAPAPPPQPAVAPAQPAPVLASAEADAVSAADPAPAGKGKGNVNLNSASVEVLNHLGGGHIGQTIIKHRPYGSVEDLVKKRVVRRSVYEQIKNQVAAQ
jgi:DNA uptake protein ComE-like DNA-binding protein